MYCTHTHPLDTAAVVDVAHVAEDSPPYAAVAPGTRLHGETLRLAMAMVEGVRLGTRDRDVARARLEQFNHDATGMALGTRTVADIKACDDAELGRQLMALARQSDRFTSQTLELLVRFNDAELYRQDGCRGMVQWMDVYLGTGRASAFEQLRVGRALRELPVCASLFATGQLSYTKARTVTRYATPATDESFAIATLELSATETEAWCERYRHEQDNAAIAAADNAEALAAMLAFEKRALRARDLDAHRTRITLDLPKDMAAEFLRSLEQCDDEVLDEVRERTGASVDTSMDAPSPTQRRADAAVLMSRRSLAHAGEAVAMADRFRVQVTVDAASLSDDVDTRIAGCSRPVRKPLINGRTPISAATARRLAELAGYTAYVLDGEGDPVASMRQAPPFTRRQLRALRARDGCCQMPGCGATRHLDGHHVLPRAQGGRSTLDNAVLLCGSCHRLLHEGGFRLERVSLQGNAPPTDEVRRYRLFDSRGHECGSRGAALSRAGCGEVQAGPDESTRVNDRPCINESTWRDRHAGPYRFSTTQETWNCRYLPDHA